MLLGSLLQWQLWSEWLHCKFHAAPAAGGAAAAPHLRECRRLMLRRYVRLPTPGLLRSRPILRQPFLRRHSSAAVPLPPVEWRVDWMDESRAAGENGEGRWGRKPGSSGAGEDLYSTAVLTAVRRASCVCVWVEDGARRERDLEYGLVALRPCRLIHRRIMWKREWMD